MSRVVHVLLTVLAWLLWLLGWLVGKLFTAFVWVGCAVKVGWSDARRGRHT